MKKLKCPSCRKILEVESNKEYALCRNCKKRYNLKEDLNINKKVKTETLENEIKVLNPRRKNSIVTLVIFITILTIIIATAFSAVQIKRHHQEKKYTYKMVR